MVGAAAGCGSSHPFVSAVHAHTETMTFTDGVPSVVGAPALAPAAVAFLDARDGFLATTGGGQWVPKVGWERPRQPARIQRTIDGGLTWRTVWSRPGIVLQNLSLGRHPDATGMRSPMTGGYGPTPVEPKDDVTLVTADGGRTWSLGGRAQPTSLLRGHSGSTVYETIDAQTATRIRRSDDGGRTWRTVLDLRGRRRWVAIERLGVVDPLHVWAVSTRTIRASTSSTCTSPMTAGATGHGGAFPHCRLPSRPAAWPGRSTARRPRCGARSTRDALGGSARRRGPSGCTPLTSRRRTRSRSRRASASFTPPTAVAPGTPCLGRRSVRPRSATDSSHTCRRRTRIPSGRSSTAATRGRRCIRRDSSPSATRRSPTAATGSLPPARRLTMSARASIGRATVERPGRPCGCRREPSPRTPRRSARTPSSSRRQSTSCIGRRRRQLEGHSCPAALSGVHGQAAAADDADLCSDVIGEGARTRSVLLRTTDGRSWRVLVSNRSPLVRRVPRNVRQRRLGCWLGRRPGWRAPAMAHRRRWR